MREQVTSTSSVPSQAVKLCLATESFYPVYAGPAVRFTRYLPGFAARGLDVRVFTGTPSTVKAAMSGVDVHWRGRGNGEMLPAEEVHGVPVHRVRIPDHGSLRRSLWFSHRLVHFCRKSAFRPDVVQLLSLSFTGVPALWRLRQLGIPTVFTKTMVGEQPDNPFKRELLRRYVSVPLELVSRVVVSSSIMREKLKELAINTPVEVIPNGVDVERFRPPRDPEERLKERRRLGIPAEDPVALFAGPVSPRKGIDILLETWCRLAPKYPRLRLLIVGPRRDATDPAHKAFHQKLERLLAASGASERVHFVGLVENVEDFMRTADLFVFTSRREGMPNVVPEAMASRLPVVTTPFTGLPKEFGRAGKHYLLASFEPADLAATIEMLLSNKQRSLDLGRAARRWVDDEMAVEKSLDRYAKLYRDVALPKNGK